MMEFQSVKQTAERFSISERRVQKLCEEGRIEGARRISNVWLIPGNAVKPTDERMVVSDADCLSLSDLCKELSVSMATGRNWLKLGKLTPSLAIKNTPFFSKEYVDSLKNELKSGEKAALKSRRNKKFVSGSKLYSSYVSESSRNLPIVQRLLEDAERIRAAWTEEVLRLVLAECAIQLIRGKYAYSEKSGLLLPYIHGELPAMHEWFLVDDLIGEKKNAEPIITEYPELFSYTFVYEPAEDVLGLLYISLKELGERKATGSYYTPTKVVRQLCAKLFERNDPFDKKVLDPCCGSGNFILQLPAGIGYENVYGNDIDRISVQIARINYVLKYGVKDAETVCSHITEGDYLSFGNGRAYDFIIGNPPWGFDFTDDQKMGLKRKYASARGNGIESYDVFIEQALSNLKENGVLSFVLPEAILNVKSHEPVRRLMLETSSFQYLEYLGNVFDKVQCPSIILQMEYKNRAFDSTGLIVKESGRIFTVSTDRKISAACFSLSMTDAEYEIVHKMACLENKTSLGGQARFALGIVSGNNKECISREKRPENEMVLRGSDVRKYRFQPSANYIVFSPETFQQVAPAALYRAPEKLLYRFISNQLVFAYDNQQTLSLNSCNILIPEIPGLDIKYVMAVLNSRCMQFYFRKQYNSVKVLRTHLEQLPIPAATKAEQDEILICVDDILKSQDDAEILRLYDRIEAMVLHLFGISEQEYVLIRASMDGEKMLL